MTNEDQIPRAFVAGPFTSTLAESGQMGLEHQRFITSIIACAEAAGYQVLNAHVREEWGRALMGPSECVPLDLEGVCSADLFIALPGDPASGGVHVEIGWASAHSIPTVLLLEKDAYYSPLVLGLETVAPVWTVRWSTLDDCVSQLAATLAEFGAAEIDAAVRVLSSRQLFRYLPDAQEAHRFEEALAHRLGARHAVGRSTAGRPRSSAG